MKKKYIDHRMSLYSVTEEIEGALALLVSLGFSNLRDEKQRELFGKVITISDALKTKGISLDAFTEMLGEHGIEEEQNHSMKIKMAGVLPCPVRVPLLESFEEWLSEREFPFHLEYDLKAA